MPTNASVTGFCVDHVIPQKHNGKTLADNLALSCFECNSFKLDNLTGIDPATEVITRLFNPRIDRWSEHFHWKQALLRGTSNVGRATIEVLRINLDARIEQRECLIAIGVLDICSVE